MFKPKSNSRRKLNIFSLRFNSKRLVLGFALLLFGMTFLINGFIGAVFESGVLKQRLSDAEIIERAKELGLVEIKEIINSEN